MKTAEEFAEELREREETGILHSMYERVSKHSLTHQEAIEAIEYRDAEIHQMYAPVVEALKATPALRMQNGPHKGLMRLELFLDESTLAAIKEVKG